MISIILRLQGAQAGRPRTSFVDTFARVGHGHTQHTALCAARASQRHPRAAFTNVTTADALAPDQPPLTITYTNEGAAVSEWLRSHVGRNRDAVLGFDTETVPTVRRSSRLYRGPATLQLARADGACLVLHLAHVKRKHVFRSPSSAGVQDAQEGTGTLHRFQGLDDLAEVLRDASVLKAGVGIDLDAIDLWREHRLVLAGRFDIGGIGAKKNRVQGLQKLSEMVAGLELQKSKSLSMSDWSVVPLTLRQLEYAAGDAFAAAAVVETLSAPRPPPTAAPPLPCFHDLDRLRGAVAARERPVEEIEARATTRRAAKKELRARQAALDQLQSSVEPADGAAGRAPTPRVPVERRLRRELEENPEGFVANMAEAERVFYETAPDRALSSQDFAALGML